MGILAIKKMLSVFGFGKTKADQEKILIKQGVKFNGAKNKHLRLYFEAQFTPDLEEDDLDYLTLIFMQKTYLLFGSYYSLLSPLNVDTFLKETFDKLVDTRYRELHERTISHKFKDNPEMLAHIFNYKVTTYTYDEYKVCRVNYWAQKSNDIAEDFNISPKVMQEIKSTNEIEIYNLLKENTNLIFFILNKVFEAYSKTVTKVKIYQIGIKSIDESVFTFLASYVKSNPKITTICLINKPIKELKHLKNILEQTDDSNEKLEGEIHNVQHIFNLYQVMMKKSNILELRIMLFLTHYNFSMLAMVLKNNQEMKILHVRNINTRDRDQDLDYTYKEMNDYGDNIKDEIFIFFNYLYNLEFLEELRLTHFNFMSEINFMAVQVAKSLKKLKILSLEGNQGMITNDAIMTESYNLAITNIEQLNMGMTFYHTARAFDQLININCLKEIDVGVVDMTTFSALLKYINRTSLERVEVKLNKPAIYESIPIIFDQIISGPFECKTLKFLYILNIYDPTIVNENLYKGKAMQKLLYALNQNQTIRKLSFFKPGNQFYELNEIYNFNTFCYISKNKSNQTIYYIKSMERIFKDYSSELVASIIKKVIIMAFCLNRKIILN